ncbi:unnamed protein product [Clonostachys rosea]|uniref:Rhodopsin domain-containing protein n=1 Tax=Bionectria ochroleuca TaxID=29856 RepID=A0ABY6UBC7_BIOOC|nr:unnamed protein product [Clonostachys rosea]
MSSTTFDPAWAAESQTVQILAVTTVFHCLALLVVGLRSYTRIGILGSFGPQDVFMILATLCSLLGGTVTLYMQVPYGLGRHKDTIDPSLLIEFNKFSFIQSIVPLMGGIGFLKIAIALELMKLRGNALAWYNYVLWGLIVFVTAYTIMAWCSFFLYCRPLAKYWDSSIEGTCYSVAVFIKFGLANTGFNIFTDVAFATLPVGIVWTLKMPLKTRLYLIGVLSLGYVAVVMGILKAVAQINFNPFGDGTYAYEIQFWGLLQLNLGISAACAPSLKPLVKNILSLTSWTPRYGYTGSGGYNARSGGNRATALYTIGGTASRGYAKQNSRVDGDDFELRSARRPDSLGATNYVARAEARDSTKSDGMYGKDGESAGERNGSEETILHADDRKKAIVKTTEVTITY